MHQAQSEITSFTQKFQNLCRAGKDATLSFSSNAGKVKATLSVDPGKLQPQPRYPPHHQLGAKLARNGPSQQRRRERRAESRALAAVEAVKELPEEEARILELAEEAENKSENASENIIENLENPHIVTVEVNANPIDEFSPESNDAAEKVDEDVDIVLKPTYCRICEECPEEMESSEDISDHVMNDHETKLVYKEYGKLWVNQRRYCIRRGSPFKLEI